MQRGGHLWQSNGDATERRGENATSHARVEGPEGRSGSETLGGMLHQPRPLQHRPREVRAPDTDRPDATIRDLYCPQAKGAWDVEI
jgi:hypothetical protein